MRRALFSIIAFALCLSMLSWRAPHDEKPSDSELLGKAIEYFQSGKFHEALLLFDKLDNRYKLFATTTTGTMRRRVSSSTLSSHSWSPSHPTNVPSTITLMPRATSI